MCHESLDRIEGLSIDAPIREMNQNALNIVSHGFVCLDERPTTIANDSGLRLERVVQGGRSCEWLVVRTERRR
jgi:hypothetical protein